MDRVEVYDEAAKVAIMGEAPKHTPGAVDDPIECRERLGGLLKYYHRGAG